MSGQEKNVPSHWGEDDLGKYIHAMTVPGHITGVYIQYLVPKQMGFGYSAAEVNASLFATERGTPPESELERPHKIQLNRDQEIEPGNELTLGKWYFLSDDYTVLEK